MPTLALCAYVNSLGIPFSGRSLQCNDSFDARRSAHHATCRKSSERNQVAESSMRARRRKHPLISSQLRLPTGQWRKGACRPNLLRDPSDLCNVDHVSSYVRPSQFGAMLCVLEDNEAVIKIIIKGRCSTMRHVSRNLRVELDWLFDRINLDSKIQIRYMDTKHQLADMLVKGNFTRDDWNHLLHLFNISHFSSLCCAQNFSLTSCSQNDGEGDARTKRRRQDLWQNRSRRR